MCTKHETLLVSLLSQNKFQILGQIGQGLGCGMEIFPRYLNCVSSKWDAYVRNCNVIGLALGFQWFIFGVAILAILYFRGRFVCMVIPEVLQKSIHLRNFFIPIYFSLYKWKFYLFSFIFIFFQLLFPKSFGEIFTLTRFLGLIETQVNGKFRRLFTSRLGSSLITLTSWYVVLWSHSHVFFFPPRSRLATQKLLMLCWDFCYKHKKSIFAFLCFYSENGNENQVNLVNWSLITEVIVYLIETVYVGMLLPGNSLGGHWDYWYEAHLILAWVNLA